MNKIVSRVVRSFSTTHSGTPPQFLNYYLLRLEYGRDGYYETYQHRKKFKQQIQDIENKMEARILGGDNFPKNSTTLLFNCNSIEIPKQFAANCIYNRKKYVRSVDIEELELISSEKFQKIWQFYQPQVE